MRSDSRLCTMLLALGIVAVVPQTAHAVFGPIAQISRGASGTQPDDESFAPAVNADGTVIAFVSRATNLVAGDTNGSADVFIADRTAGTLTRIVGFDGEFLSDSDAPEISDDGQFVAFTVDGTLKVFGRGFAGLQDVTILNHQPYAFSGNGRFLALTADDDQQLSETDQNGVTDVYLFDRLTQTFERVSRLSDSGEPDNDSFAPAITPDGRYVAFVSSASNLVATDNGHVGVFVLDRIANTIERVSGAGADETDPVTDPPVPPALSADGRFVAYLASDSLTNIRVYLRDRTTQTTMLLGIGDGNGGIPDLSTNSLLSLSRDGRRVVYGALRDFEDVLVFDLNTAMTTIVSRGQTASDGDSIGARLSANGRAIVFASDATNLTSPGPDGTVNNVYVATSGPMCAGIGDINCDGQVDAADIPALIHLIFGGS